MMIVGAACLYYMVRHLAVNSEQDIKIFSLLDCNIAVKKRIIQTLLDTMEKFKVNVTFLLDRSLQ